MSALMAMNPIVSIIVPVYRVEPYLRRCLDSICDQTLHDIEIIAINDASPDRCDVILEEYARRDERVRVITHSQNRGVAATRNSGLENAKGKYIGFVDADDYVDANMYETLVHYAAEANADMVYCGFKMVYGDGSQSAASVPDDARYDLRNAVDCRQAFRRIGFMTVNKLFAAATIREVRFPSLVFSEDSAFNIACFCRCRIVRSVPFAPYAYYWRQDSSVKTHTMGGIESWGRFLELVRGILREEGHGELWPEFASEARTLILKWMVKAIYVRSDPAEKRQLWKQCVDQYVPILVEPGFQPYWRRVWIKAAFTTKNIGVAYWCTSVPCRVEEKCIRMARKIIKSFRQRGL